MVREEGRKGWRAAQARETRIQQRHSSPSPRRLAPAQLAWWRSEAVRLRDRHLLIKVPTVVDYGGFACVASKCLTTANRRLYKINLCVVCRYISVSPILRAPCPLSTCPPLSIQFAAIFPRRLEATGDLFSRRHSALFPRSQHGGKCAARTARAGRDPPERHEGTRVAPRQRSCPVPPLLQCAHQNAVRAPRCARVGRGRERERGRRQSGRREEREGVVCVCVCGERGGGVG